MNWMKFSVVSLVVLAMSACGGPGEQPKKDDENNELVEIDGQNSSNGPESNGQPDDSDASNGDNPTEGEQVCGNGVIDADEACDDGNVESRDGCSETCDIETVVFRNLEAALERGGLSCDDFGCNAEYRITLTLNNFSDVPVKEMTSLRLTLGGYELSSGGVSCDWEEWQVEPEGRSDVINLHANYSTYYETLEAEYQCTDEYDDRTMAYVPQEGDRFSELETVELEVTGLLDDGAVWTTSATTDVRDLR